MASRFASESATEFALTSANSLNCACRLTARAATSAVKKIFNSATGQTVVPISRPSTTTPPNSAMLFSIKSLCKVNNSARTSGTALMPLTELVINSSRITADKSLVLSLWSGSIATNIGFNGSKLKFNLLPRTKFEISCGALTPSC